CGSPMYWRNQPGSLYKIENYSIAIQLAHLSGTIAVRHAEYRASGRACRPSVVRRVADDQHFGRRHTELPSAMQQWQRIRLPPRQAVAAQHQIEEATQSGGLQQGHRESFRFVGDAGKVEARLPEPLQPGLNTGIWLSAT